MSNASRGFQTILDKIKWNSKPQSPLQIKDEAAWRAKTRHFPIHDLGGRGGLGFPFILSKIVATVASVVRFYEQPALITKLYLISSDYVQFNFFQHSM